MKKNILLLGLSVIFIAFAIRNFSLDIDNNGHYFGNGILCGIGISLLVVQLLNIKKNKKAD
ncbi:MAG: hypothetical protein KF825_08355 [Ferruginibacter sp.]|nr:hypothetical protein [Bacteroidota bacterium]MBX2934243.1 hypothetical protein [Ferruginibacter sp.]